MAEATTATKKQHYYPGVGRRKQAIATVRLSNGKGVITVNEKPAEQYFGNQNLAARLIRPLELVGKTNAVDINLKTKGGGLQAQADACVLAISRALQEYSADFRPNLRKSGFLTRDSREKERKKYGLKKARKAPQFSKR
ncbi:30S ribosomal protein S9 [Candidatus Saccharibacteria bacterium]|nr:30S ribosomal protein S9 [Candidatus Saccharibacteria bacterium]